MIYEIKKLHIMFTSSRAGTILSYRVDPHPHLVWVLRPEKLQEGLRLSGYQGSSRACPKVVLESRERKLA